jgi:hypothetical protein
VPSQRSFRKLQDYPGVFRAWAAGIPEFTVSVGASLSAACSICILGALVGFSDVTAWAGRSIFWQEGAALKEHILHLAVVAVVLAGGHHELRVPRQQG